MKYNKKLETNNNDYFKWKIICSSMGLITQNYIRLNNRNLFLRIIIFVILKNKDYTLQ